MNKLPLLLMTSLIICTAYNPNKFSTYMMMITNKQIIYSHVSDKSTGIQALVNEFSLYSTVPEFGI